MATGKCAPTKQSRRPAMASFSHKILHVWVQTLVSNSCILGEVPKNQGAPSEIRPWTILAESLLDSCLKKLAVWPYAEVPCRAAPCPAVPYHTVLLRTTVRYLAVPDHTEPFPTAQERATQDCTRIEGERERERAERERERERDVTERFLQYSRSTQGWETPKGYMIIMLCPVVSVLVGLSAG